jgi:hypothetical protein
MKTFRKYFLLLVKQIEKRLRYGFNDNTGYFFHARLYYYEGAPQVGFVICKGYRYFWINGHVKIEVVPDKETLNKKIEEYKNIGINIDLWEEGLWS